MSWKIGLLKGVENLWCTLIHVTSRTSLAVTSTQNTRSTSLIPTQFISACSGNAESPQCYISMKSLRKYRVYELESRILSLGWPQASVNRDRDNGCVNNAAPTQGIVNNCEYSFAVIGKRLSL